LNDRLKPQLWIQTVVAMKQGGARYEGDKEVIGVGDGLPVLDDLRVLERR
jgi:hypothetical protein